VTPTTKSTETFARGAIASVSMHNDSSESVDLRFFDLLSSGNLLRQITSRHAEVATFRVRLRGCESIVAVKHLRLNAPYARQSIQNEFLTLRWLQKVLGESLSRTIPRPLLLLENEQTIVFTFVPGTPLNHLLRRDANALTARLNIIGTRRLEACGFRIGEWLKAFHDATAVEDQTFDHLRFSAELDSLLAKCEPLGLSSPALKAVRDAALSLSANSSGCMVSAAATHGDFLPQNVLLDRGLPGVIDFASFCPSGPVYTDVAHFIGYLEILARKPLYSRKTVESVARQFMSGYHRVLNLDMLRLYVVRAILRIIADGKQQSLSGLVHTTTDLLSSILNRRLTDLIPE